MNYLPSCLCIFGLATVSMAQDVVITQNTECDIDANSMVACGDAAGGTTAENWFARNIFIDQDVTINSLTWGSAQTSTISANIFFSTASGSGNPESLTLTPVGSAVQAIDAGPFYDTPVGTPFLVPAGTYLVVEIQFPDSGTDQGIWPANTSSATETTYLKAADCGITAYTSVDDIGFADSQIIMCINATVGEFDPCDVPLSNCPYDITGPAGVPDGLINVDDVLGCIGTFGTSGDGTSRPLGDVNPLPAGNCYVDVDDLLDIIGAFGGDCLPVGACCSITSCVDNVKEADCADSWLGDGSTCADCVGGACCNDDGSCDYTLEGDCAGSFNAGMACADVTCGVAPDNNSCAGAIAISDGDTAIDNTAATSNGDADFTLCDNFDEEMVYNDIWFSYTASCDGMVTMSTCDLVDFDSRLAVYDACGGTMLVCNDDCGGASNGLSSELALDLGAGDMVVIRVGNFAEGAGGTGVLNVSCEVPSAGACCLGPQDCLDGLYPADCADFGGDYMGSGTDCATVMCGAAGDSCGEAVAFVDGGNAFDTSNATDSGFGEPDDTQCDGTYLDWTASPDAWGRYEVSGDGTLSVSLCDSASYDTSLVLYEGADCGSLTQVACNGDNAVETGCQSYYSGIYEHPVTAGSVLYIRMGGWQGATGPGTCTITFTGAGAMGACCVSGSCIGETTSPDCADFGGSWYVGEACADVSCPQDVGCNTGNGESPTAIDGAWTAGTSDGGSGYLRAADCSAASAADVTVYGLSLVYSGGWGACGDASAMAMSMDVMDASYGVLATASATYSATNLVYAGVYALHGWTAASGYAGSVGAVSGYSLSAGQGECWFLWMSSDAGTSAINDGTGWIAEAFGVNYCITE